MPGLLSRERITAGPDFNRWLMFPAALLISLSVGQAYPFSVFNLPLSRANRHHRAGAGRLEAHDARLDLSGCRPPWPRGGRRRRDLASGLAKAEAYNTTMYIMAALLVAGFFCNLAVRPAPVRRQAAGPHAAAGNVGSVVSCES